MRERERARVEHVVGPVAALERAIVGAALDETDGAVGVLAQPRCEHAAGRPAADDDRVERALTCRPSQNLGAAERARPARGGSRGHGRQDRVGLRRDGWLLVCHSSAALRTLLGSLPRRPRLDFMVRKTVTLVFCDVVDSTPLGERLDPEALRDVWSRYHATSREVLERHGGTIEKFVGDAVMAAFGIPVVHEDDAVRAVRAAVELRAAIAELNAELERTYGVRIGVRTGVNTGEVLAGDASQGQAFATGDAVVVAQRLEAAAGSGEILIGEVTFRLVRDAVEAEPVAPIEVKGKSEPVVAWRLLEVEPGVAGLVRRMDSPLVGRVGGARPARARARPGQGGAVVPHDHDRRRAGRRQVPTRGRARQLARGRGARARGRLPPLRQRDHVLAARRDRAPPRPRRGARRRAGRRRHPRAYRRSGRPRRAAFAERRALLGRAAAPRDARPRPARRARPGRRPVGGAGLPRPRRVPGRLEPGRAGLHLLPRPQRVHGDQAGLADAAARAAAARRRGGAARAPRRTARRATPHARSAGPPAAIRSSSARWCGCWRRTTGWSSATGGSPRSSTRSRCPRRSRRCSPPVSTASPTTSATCCSARP